MTEKSPQDVRRPLRIVIIGAGIAGLALAYGLQHVPNISVRVLEKRQEHECKEGGYPIHLAPSGREALERLLMPKDKLKLLEARKKFPASHDGVTIISSRLGSDKGEQNSNPGQKVWRMVKSPGEKCLLERRDLIDILQSGLCCQAGDRVHPIKVEYGMGMVDLEHDGYCWKVVLAGGESITCDLLVGADGMFSKVRTRILPLNSTIQTRVGEKIDNGRKARREDPAVQALPWTIINLRPSSHEVRRWIKDQDSMNLIYGDGWSAAFMPLGYSDHPNSLPGSTDDSLQEKSGIDSTPCPSISDSTRIESDTRCYVALTLLHDKPTLQDSIASLPDARIPDSFLANILSDPGFPQARAFPLYTMKRTITLQSGKSHPDPLRGVLIGDASHGMVPYCGAGASSGLKDASDLVSLIQNHTSFDGDLDFLLDQFQNAQKEFNDPLINTSRRVLWIAQGETVPKRILRFIAFRALEIGERVTGHRKQADSAMKRWKGHEK